MGRIRVGVLRGGPSSEYEVSLKTGASVLRNLSPEKYQPRDVLLTKDGYWHIDGLPTKPERLPHSIDVIFNALHGTYGEDGKVQQLLDSLAVPYTGSGAFSSAIAMNKAVAKDYFSSRGLKTPRHFLLKDSDSIEKAAKAIFQKISPPWIVKPADNGSSVGVSIAENFPKMLEAIDEALQISDAVMVEEYIKGKEATCGVVEKFRGKETYALLPIEIKPPKEKKFFDYEAKYSGATEEICPGNFSQKEKDIIQNMAEAAHRALGLRHYSRSDFIISPNRGIFILETNSLPGLTDQSLLPKSLSVIGARYDHFLDHVISLALGEKY